MHYSWNRLLAVERRSSRATAFAEVSNINKHIWTWRQVFTAELSLRWSTHINVAGSWNLHILLTPLSYVLLEKPTASQPFKKLLAHVHYSVHSSPLLVHILSEINRVYTHLSNFCKFHFNIILPLISRCSYWSLSITFSYQNRICTPLPSALHSVTCML
jgi:hypothetical protein